MFSRRLLSVEEPVRVNGALEHLLWTILHYISIPLEVLELQSLFLRPTGGFVNGHQSVRVQPSCIPGNQAAELSS